MRTAKNTTPLNTLSSTVQALITGITYFFLYKFLLRQIGPDKLGLFSLILSTSSLANLANFGLTSGTIKFVAEYNQLKKKDRIVKLVFTSNISLLIFLTTIISIVYISSFYWLKYFVDPRYIELALRLLPYSLVSLIINTTGGVFTSVLDGFQKNYIKNIIYVIGILLFTLQCFILTPLYGVIGLAYAQVGQAIFVFITAFYFARGLYKRHSTDFFAWNWDTPIFKELFSYGTRFQLISICQMFLDPVTKMFLSKFGGVQMVAYYEMSNRLVNQFRSLIISANQAMIPVIAAAAVETKQKSKEIYKSTISLIMFIEVPLIVLIIIFAPVISYIWIGKVEHSFLIFLYLLLMAAFIHILNGPAYFGILAEGKLKIMLRVSILMSIVNVLLAYSLNFLWIGYGSAAGAAITIIGQCLLLSLSYQREHHIKTKELFTKKDLQLFFAGVLISVLSIIPNIRPSGNPAVLKNLTIGLALFCFVLLPLIGKHPKFRYLKTKLNLTTRPA